MSSSQKKLFLTGASGLLGRGIRKEFLDSNWMVYGTALSRVGPGLNKLDLTDLTTVENVVTEFKPDIVIHCAAQRFPDKVDSDPNAAESLNVNSTRHLAKIANSIGIPMIYISTDYVFDGNAPPYHVNDTPNPLNLYGKTKLDGEKAVLEVNKANIVLRIPVIYGHVEKLSESAVTVLLENLMNASTPSKVSNYERRRPSSVNDIAKICLQLASKRSKDSAVSGIFHWCGKEMMTKYTMVLQMAEVFKLPHEHITAASNESSTGTARPFDTTMDVSRLEAMGISVHTPFKDGIHTALAQWL